MSLPFDYDRVAVGERIVDDPPVGTNGENVGAENPAQRHERHALLGGLKGGVQRRAGGLAHLDAAVEHRIGETRRRAELAKAHRRGFKCCDRAGNVWIGRQRDLATMAHAAVRTVVTVEKIVDGDLLSNPVLAAGVLPGFYVERIAVAEKGCWPLGLPDLYAADLDHLAAYARMAATAEGFAAYLAEHVHARRAA